MKNVRILFGAVLGLALTALAAASSPAPTIILPGQEHWVGGMGPMQGTMVATLAGNPEGTGFYAMRLKLPAGTVFAPHFHDNTENVTVISGTLMVGLGDTVDKTKMISVPAGSFVTVPAGLHHYAIANEATVIDIEGDGPESMHPVK